MAHRRSYCSNQFNRFDLLWSCNIVVEFVKLIFALFVGECYLYTRVILIISQDITLYNKSTFKNNYKIAFYLCIAKVLLKNNFYVICVL